MAKIIGNTTTTPMAIPDWNQSDSTKADYIKNKPEYLTNFFKEVPEGKTIDDLWGWGAYLIEGNTILLISEFPNGYDEVNMQDLTGYEQTMIKPDGSILYRRKEDFGLAWSDWEESGSSNIIDGLTEGSVQNTLSDAGAKVFSFVVDHEYTEEDIAEKRYYLTYVVDNMLNKPFSIVLGENYDFLGTITSVVKNETDNGGYITVDNYKIPNKDSNTTIYDNSYILLPYDRVDSSDNYTWNNQYVNEGAHLLGDTIIGTGGTSFGYDNHVLAIGGISAGLSNISAGKYSGTFGRYNVTGYCDFALGQNMKILGHWNAGFGRDNYIATTSDYSIVSGLRNEIYNKYCSASGRGHVLKFDDATARGRYSETDESYRYIDRVGYGTGFEPSQRKNIYTLDKEGNGWFRGDVRVGGDNYDNAETLLTIKEYETVDELTQNQAVLGDIAKVSHMVAAYPANEHTEYSLAL